MAGLLLVLSVWAAGLSSAEASGRNSRIANILILHSYHQGLQWTDSISSGIKAELENLSGDIELHFEYLDTKRHAGEDYRSHLASFSKFKTRLNEIEYALIICSDNNALKFIQDYGDELYPGVPVVFCGVNNFTPELVTGIDQVTGIVEYIDYQGTLDLISSIHPGRNNIVVVIDRTPTGVAIKKELEAVSVKYLERFSFEYLQDFSLDEIPKHISRLGKKDLIYLLTLNRDKNGHFISYIDGIRLIRTASSVPIYGSWEFYFGNGIVGGMITSGFDHGQKAAKMAKQILAGQKANDIPVLKRNQSPALFDARELKAFGIGRGQLPKNSRILHEPQGFFERYRKFFLITLVFGIILLAWRLSIVRRRQAELTRLNTELDRRVAEQTFDIRKKNSALEKEIEERTKLEQEIRTLASTDPLTGICNRRSFLERASKELARSARYGGDYSILMLDLDNFKSINDSYGHHIGDLCLKRFVETCVHELRDNDIFGRLGGEEFAVMLVSSGCEEAVKIAERLRLKVENIRISHGDASLYFTVSIGVACLAEDDETIEWLLQRADRGLYRAKESGRNKVVCA